MLNFKLLLHLVVLLAEVLLPVLAIFLEEIQKCFVFGIEFLFLSLSLLLFRLFACLIEKVHVDSLGHATHI